MPVSNQGGRSAGSSKRSRARRDPCPALPARRPASARVAAACPWGGFRGGRPPLSRRKVTCPSRARPIPARRISVKRSIVLELAARSGRQRDLGLLDVDVFADRLDLSVRELEDEAIFVLVRLTRDRRATVDELDDHRVALAVRFVDLGLEATWKGLHHAVEKRADCLFALLDTGYAFEFSRDEPRHVVREVRQRSLDVSAQHCLPRSLHEIFVRFDRHRHLLCWISRLLLVTAYGSQAGGSAQNCGVRATVDIS